MTSIFAASGIACDIAFRARSGSSRWLDRRAAAMVFAIACVLGSAAPAAAQTVSAANCPTGNPLLPPLEIDLSAPGPANTIALVDQTQNMPTSAGGVLKSCDYQLVRAFVIGVPPGIPGPSPDPVPAQAVQPGAGPTLRAHVGDTVRLGFVNIVNPNRFNLNLDVNACMTSGQNGSVYPGTFDTPPNCLHASSTANLHFHGTHTSPNTTADNVYLQVRPLPRDTQGRLLPSASPVKAMVGFQTFFDRCERRLAGHPLLQWPARWSDMPQAWVGKQTELLKAYQAANPGQNLWDQDKALIYKGWPQNYIGAFPYCFALPEYKDAAWPPPKPHHGPAPLQMGQSPGTHWYHAHKHGSTAINVANGMTGAFIVEGQYDTDLTKGYSGYILKDGKPWVARDAKIMVLNQIGTTPNLLTPKGSNGNPAGVDFVVNGQLRPVVAMQPGEVQMWRIVNSSARNAANFTVPGGFHWRLLARDGVQLAKSNYDGSLDQPFYLAPGNRVDLLVQAPEATGTTVLNIQQAMARAELAPTLGPLPPKSSVKAAATPTPLFGIAVDGPAVLKDGMPIKQMPFLGDESAQPVPAQPVFLQEISGAEWEASNFATKTLVFNSGPPKTPLQHTINGQQFQNGDAQMKVFLGNVEEWKIVNTTSSNGPGFIDHPFHIHVNPFQIVEFFDPNAPLRDEKGQPVIASDGTTVPVYVFNAADIQYPAQCVIDPQNSESWKPCVKSTEKDRVWWDTFAIPSGRVARDINGNSIKDLATDRPVVIPGYFKMRSRFVDYPGYYVLHCHILVHEDRGMMFSVEVVKPPEMLMTHH